jgi:hypothetical protein
MHAVLSTDVFVYKRRWGKLCRNILVNPFSIDPSMASILKMGVVKIQKLGISGLGRSECVHPFYRTAVELQPEGAERRQGAPEAVACDPDLIICKTFRCIHDFFFD